MTRIPDDYLSTNRRVFYVMGASNIDGYPMYVTEHLFAEYKALESHIAKVLPLLPTHPRWLTVEQWEAIQGIREMMPKGGNDGTV